MAHRITLIPGDGIGPEVTTAALRVAEATGVSLDWEVVQAGEVAIRESGTALPEAVLESIRRNRLALKGPITTPIGSGFRSVNVALRQQLDLFASVRPARAIAGAGTRFPETDLVVVREATEGLYSGVEHWVDREHSAAETVNVITRKACDRITKFAFELARRERRRKVTGVHKANIMKTTGALFQTAFREMAQQYPDIPSDERLVDNACMQLVKRPSEYDVIVTTNLFGDILSDLCAGLAGGLGVAPGALYGESMALFEPVHGSAPKYAGQDRANPVAEILSLELLLRHIGEAEAAERVFRAVWETIAERQVLTYDLAGPGSTDQPVVASSCSAMAAEIARRVPLVDLSRPRPAYHPSSKS
ncbi:MAG: isocitrate/isopropylmalate dehydrogenase family protein [Thermoplasmata archaeon]|nr:isocitrate/isopropylmalate dehydrogenase family protein [Thermoplasmata archaeon]MCI4359336.1 isocitrate/isopropylmalate dehydrogenase family protein [Thermoplasmata archaeon]